MLFYGFWFLFDSYYLYSFSFIFVAPVVVRVDLELIYKK